VGIKGVRIQAIVKELHDEKIDIIQWDPDPVVYISKAISPARVSGVYLSEASETGRTATVVVQEDQLSLAIGRDGQNARLAAKLTGWRIDIKSLVEAAGDSVQKLQTDAELAALLPTVIENVPVVEQVLTKKSEGRPLTPEEYTMLAQFVDRVERRTIQIQEEAAREEEERLATAKAEVPAAAFQMPLEQAGLKEHVFNILTEAEFETVGDLMLAMKVNPNKVLGLPGVGPKAMDNIHEALAALSFPEPEPVVEELPVAEPAAEAEPAVEVPVVAEQAELQVEAIAEALEPAAEEKAKKKKEERVEEIDTSDRVKDSVSLDDLFALKEMFQTGGAEEEEEEQAGDKKSKKKKKKHVEIEYDEELGEVVSRKKHKRSDGDLEGNW
jgi:N utilization substance protein A